MWFFSYLFCCLWASNNIFNLFVAACCILSEHWMRVFKSSRRGTNSEKILFVCLCVFFSESDYTVFGTIQGLGKERFTLLRMGRNYRSCFIQSQFFITLIAYVLVAAVEWKRRMFASSLFCSVYWVCSIFISFELLTLLLLLLFLLLFAVCFCSLIKFHLHS